MSIILSEIALKFSSKDFETQNFFCWYSIGIQVIIVGYNSESETINRNVDETFETKYFDKVKVLQ